jgi:hypothetical protein
MKNDEQSAGLKAASEVVSATFTTTLSLINELAPSFMKVASKDDLMSASFIATCMTLSNVDRYATSVTIEGVVYPLSDYKVDSRLKALIQPRAVRMPGSSFYWVDIREHGIVDSTPLTPSDFIKEQYSIVNKFKGVPQFINVVDLLEPVSVSDVSVLVNLSENVHVEDLATLKELPLLLTINDLAWDPDYFEIPLSKALKPLAVNILSDLAARSNATKA